MIARQILLNLLVASLWLYLPNIIGVSSGGVIGSDLKVWQQWLIGYTLAECGQWLVAWLHGQRYILVSYRLAVGLLWLLLAKNPSPK